MDIASERALGARAAVILFVLLSMLSAGLGGAVAQDATDQPAEDGAQGEGASPTGGDAASGDDEAELGNLTIIRDGDEVDAVELSVRLNENTEPGPVDTVLLASSATFADGLAATSALAESALLLTPPEGPVPARVAVELERLQAKTVVLLGGESALGPEIADELTASGYDVERISGPNRIATAVEVAKRFVPDARTAILVRQDGPGTAAWADSIAAGPLAAELRLPVLLTTAGQLADETREYLDDAPISTIFIVGGEAAVPTPVHLELLDRGLIVRRIAGVDRFETAEEVLSARALPPYDRVVLFNGYDELGWQGGLAAVHHAVTSAAPMFPVRAGDVDARLTPYLESEQQLSITCVVDASICGDAVDSTSSQLPLPEITFYPPPASALTEGETIRIGVDDPDRLIDGTVSLTSNCSGELQYLPEAQGFLELVLNPDVEDGGDQQLVEGPIRVQGAISDPGGPVRPDADSGSPEPIDADEPAPARPPLVCTVTFTLPRRGEGPDVVETVTYSVVDLRPRVRISSFPVQEDRPIAFTDASDGVLDEWAWTFGDGGQSNERFPEHTYAGSGCYNVGLTITSSLAHWLTRERFRASTVRTIAVDPASSSTTRAEVLLRDARTVETGVIVPNGGVVNVYPNSGAAAAETQLITSATTDARGFASFTGLPAGELAFAPADQPDRIILQEVPRGQTLCFGLSMVATGDGEVEIRREIGDGETEPVDGAEVTITSELTGALPLNGTGDGLYVRTDIPAVSYDVTAIIDGQQRTSTLTVTADGTGTASILIPLA